MLFITERKAKIEVALAIVKMLKEDNHIRLQESVCGPAKLEAERRLGRKCGRFEGDDDDQEFYAMWDKVIDESIQLMQTMLYSERCKW